MAEQDKTQLTDKELNSLREIHISINWGGFKKAWMKMFNEAPFAAHQAVMRGVEGVSRKMMTGSGSLLGMPVGIILRNTSRAMHNSVEGRSWYRTNHVVGVLGAIGAVVAGTVIGAPVVAGLVGASVIGVVGTWASYVGAFAASAAILSVPAYTAATLISSGLVGTAVAAFSTVVAAPVNLLVAFNRSRAALKGVKLTEEQMEAIRTEFDKESPTVRYQRQLFNNVRYGLENLSEAQQQEIYTSLSDKFGAAAAPQQTAQAAAPAAKGPTPTP